MNIPQDKGRALFISILLLRDAPIKGNTLNNTASASEMTRQNAQLQQSLQASLFLLFRVLKRLMSLLHRFSHLGWHVFFIVFC